MARPILASVEALRCVLLSCSGQLGLLFYLQNAL